MTTPFTISMELLAIGNKSFLPLEILGLAETIKKKIQNKEDYSGEINKIPAILKRNVGIQVKTVIQKTPEISAGIILPVVMHSMSASNSGSWDDFWREILIELKDTNVKNSKPHLKGSVDLEEVKVTGLFSAFEFTLYLSTGLFEQLSPEEITAVILHEVGHAFTSLATLGNFVWVNYLLTDGVDILLGKKKNEYKINFLNEKLPDKEKAKAKVVASIMQQYREMHNPFVTLGTFKRSEQLADQFVSRLGFGKPLVTALDKLFRGGFNRHTDYSDVTWYRSFVQAASVAGIAISIVLLPFVAMGIFTLIPDVYDRPKERFILIKRDLVIQLRNTSHNPELTERLLADIKAIDDLTNQMDEFSSWFTRFVAVVDPIRRRATDRFKQEKQLESLLANDLFVTSAKFKNLIKA